MLIFRKFVKKLGFKMTYIKNDKQLYFNQIKGSLIELNDGEKYCSITLSVGHDNRWTVNLVMKKKQFDPETIFNKNTQDNLAKELLRRRKVYDYIKNPKSPNLSTIQNNLAKEWRSLPNTAGVSESADSGQKIGIGKQEFRDILKRVQELGPKKGVELLLKTIIEAEHTPRKNLK